MAIKPDWAVYGYAHVNFAKEQEAIETLMLSDSLFRLNKEIKLNKILLSISDLKILKKEKNM